MSNGIIPIYPSIWDLIKEGTCIDQGEFAGCIQVGDKHRWLSRDDVQKCWVVNEEPVKAEDQCKIGPQMWVMCTQQLEYDGDGGGWMIDDKLHQWGGYPTQYVYLGAV